MTTRPIVSAVTITLWTNRRPPRIHAPPTADNRLERTSSNSIIIIVTTQGWRWNSTEFSNTRRTRDDIFRAGLETRYLYIYIYIDLIIRVCRVRWLNGSARWTKVLHHARQWTYGTTESCLTSRSRDTVRDCAVVHRWYYINMYLEIDILLLTACETNLIIPLLL